MAPRSQPLSSNFISKAKNGISSLHNRPSPPRPIPKSNNTTLSLGPEDAIPLLWAHQLKREHRHLLQRIETLESAAAQPGSASPSSHDAHASTAVTNNDETTTPIPAANSFDGLESTATITTLQARLSALEHNVNADTTDVLIRALQVSNITLREQLNTLQIQLLTAVSGFEERFNNEQKERIELAVSIARIDNQVNGLDTKVSAEAVAAKRLSDDISTTRDTARELEERVWAVENGISNMESGRRDDRERFARLAGLVNALDGGVKTETEKVERVFRVAEVLIDRDMEVRGRVGELEARVEGVLGRLNVEVQAPYTRHGHHAPVESSSRGEHTHAQGNRQSEIALHRQHRQSPRAVFALNAARAPASKTKRPSPAARPDPRTPEPNPAPKRRCLDDSRLPVGLHAAGEQMSIQPQTHPQEEVQEQPQQQTYLPPRVPVVFHPQQHPRPEDHAREEEQPLPILHSQRQENPGPLQRRPNHELQQQQQHEHEQHERAEEGEEPQPHPLTKTNPPKSNRRRKSRKVGRSETIKSRSRSVKGKSKSKSKTKSRSKAPKSSVDANATATANVTHETEDEIERGQESENIATVSLSLAESKSTRTSMSTGTGGTSTGTGIPTPKSNSKGILKNHVIHPSILDTQPQPQPQLSPSQQAPARQTRSQTRAAQLVQMQPRNSEALKLGSPKARKLGNSEARFIPRTDMRIQYGIL